MDAPTNEPRDQHTGTHWAMPTTASGRCAGYLALIGIAALIVANLGFQDSNGAREFLRVSFVVMFMVSGFGSLALAARALRQTERCVPVWLALAFGTLATALTIAELTILE